MTDQEIDALWADEGLRIEQIEFRRGIAKRAIEALQGENERLDRETADLAMLADQYKAERDKLQAKLDELQRQEPVKFLVNGARFKLANCGPSSSGFVGFPKELAGRWVALVAADDNCHLKLAAPKALEPLTWQQAEQISDAPNVDEALRNFAEDQTADNAIALVQVIHEAAIESLKEPTP